MSTSSSSFRPAGTLNGKIRARISVIKRVRVTRDGSLTFTDKRHFVAPQTDTTRCILKLSLLSRLKRVFVPISGQSRKIRKHTGRLGYYDIVTELNAINYLEKKRVNR